MISKKPFKCQYVGTAPDTWTEIQRNVDPREDGASRVVFAPVSSDEISEKQLNPSEIRLRSLIEQGVSIDASSCRTLLNITDRADIERFNNEEGYKVYEYLTKNHDKLFPKEEEVNEEKDK